MAEPDFPLINHVFVLMLENHSFDHLLGFSALQGMDAESGKPTAINGLKGTESNTWQGNSYSVLRGADYSMPIDPGHEFTDTFLQLSGTAYQQGGTLQSINNSGFVADYAAHLPASVSHSKSDYQEIMKCFGPEQLPVLNALASEFAVCDNWFASIPGPTCPNRLFVHAASSGGLDHSPMNTQILAWLKFGLEFEHGSVFDQLKAKFDHPYRIYRGNRFSTDLFPSVAQIKGISSLEARSIDKFESDLLAPGYDYPYTFIEPSYGNVLNGTYKGGTSMHPLDDATGGEALIKEVYEAIRNSPLWPKSMLIVVWDEHGGFYDHVAPPKATPPTDKTVQAGMNKYGFDFSNYGVRVPAIIVSPLIPENTIDHRLYDHSSVPKTLQDLFSLTAMTQRDKHANSLFPLLLKLQQPRTDTPQYLPEPAASSKVSVAYGNENMLKPANQGSLPLFLHTALKTDLEVSPPEQHQAIQEQFSMIHTREDAAAYIDKVQHKVGSA